jgi:hypothetical protein
MTINDQKSNGPNAHGSKQYAEWITQHKAKGAEAIVLILYFLLDAHGIWPDSHSIAIAVFVLGFSAILLIELPWMTWLWTTGALIVLGSAIYAYVGPAELHDIEVTGLLQPGNEITPTTACDTRLGPHPSDTVSVLMGGGRFDAPPSGPLNLVVLGSCTAYSVDQTPQGPSLSVRISDQAGRLVALIDRNRFYAMEGSHSHLSRFGTLSGFAVTSGDGDELFFARLLNRTTLQTRGHFICGRSEVFIDDEKVKIQAPNINMIMQASCTRNTQNFLVLELPP